MRGRLQEEDLDGILISSAENRRYLSGFTGSAGHLLVSGDDAVLATDFRYVEQGAKQAPGFRVERIGREPWFGRLSAELGLKRVGFESDEMTVSAHGALQKSLEDVEAADRPELVATTSLVDRLRAVKDKSELKLLTRAVAIADKAMDRVAPTIEAGVTEREVAWELEKAMRERGAEAISFDVIVGAGPNGALPHHRADNTVIKAGDAVVIDMGATYEGYCSDLTRTFIVGEPDDTFKRVYDTVLRAQLAAEERVTAGSTGGEADAIARDIIVEAGYGDEFGHSLGHGVGLAVHEYPRVGAPSEDVLEDGMVFTIEPGIYITGWGGVRIEDIVMMEDGRARVLSRAAKLPAFGS
ncbi:MAG: aminopeptidase P family protein [Chloroflexi bacterium]|nr:aminopeptidase P family protein [Chloroflexota bacterium]